MIAVLALACGSSPALCGSFTSTLNFVVFTLTHVCMHSAILAGVGGWVAHSFSPSVLESCPLKFKIRSVWDILFAFL